MTVRTAAAAIVLACFTSVPAAASDWPTFDHDSARSGVDSGDAILDVGNIGRLHVRWQTQYGVVADSTPILIERVRIGGAFRPVLYQTAKNGTTFALEAKTGKILWRFVTHGPQITTSTPVEDPSGTSLYVPGVDGFVHKLDAATGHELRAPGFPARITRLPQTEKDASALNLANGFLYATTSGYYGDAPFYDGHVVAIRLSNGEMRVFNSLCSTVRVLPVASDCPNESDSGIWGRGGAVVDPDPAMKGRVYAATGNGNFDANTGGHDYGDSVVSLSPDAAMLLGNYTPADYGALDSGDVDLGSTSPVMLPRQNASRTPLVLVQGGKDAIWRLVDREHLPGVGGELQEINLPAGLFSTPAVWNDGGRTTVFLGFSQEIDAYRFGVDAQGRSRLAEAWHSRGGSSSGEGSSPVVSNGIVFGAYDGAIVALDARNGRRLWSSANAGRTIGPVHWESPIVVNGWVYCSDENGAVTAYALP